MHARLRIGQQRQRVNVSRFQLGDVPVFEHQARHFVLLGQVLQHVLRGGNSLALAAARRRGQSQMRKQHLAKLLRRIDIEPPSGQRKDALAHALQLRREPLRQPVQHAQIDAHAGLLHAEQNRRQRQIDLLIHALHARLFRFIPQRRRQRMNRRRARRQRRRRGLSMARGHIGQRLRGVRGIERIGEQHRVVHRAAQRSRPAQ